MGNDLDLSFLDDVIDTVVEGLKDPLQPQYSHQPVSIQTFVEDPQYLNLGGKLYSFGHVYPVWMDELIQIFGDTYRLELPYRQVVYIASPGTGKSFVSSIILSYLVYRDLCVKNLRKVFGLSDSALLACLNVSITQTQAKNIVFGEIKSKLESSTWFQRNFRKDPKIDSVIRLQGFEKDVWKDTRYLIFPGACNEKVPIGYNIRGGIVDEVNFFQWTLESVRKGVREWDAASEVVDGFLKRIKSRGNESFWNSSFLCMITSARYADSFAEKKEEESLKNPEIHFRRISSLEAKKSVFINQPSFKISVSKQLVVNESLLDFSSNPTTEEIINKARNFGFSGNGVDLAIQYIVDFQQGLIDVPVLFKTDFQKDFNKAVRDVLALPVLAVSPFFSDKELIWTCCYVERRNPITPDGELQSWFRGEPGIQYFGHLDLAENKCAAGLAMGHWDKVNSVVYMDLILRILSHRGEVRYPGQEIVLEYNDTGEISVEKIEDFLLYLKKSRSFNFRLFTTDQFQSLGTRQKLNDNGIPCEKSSVIRGGKHNFINLKDLFFRRQINFYLSYPFVEEMKSAEEVKDKVLPGFGGRIDVFEAVAGCVRNILESMGGISEIPSPIVASGGGLMQQGMPSFQGRNIPSRGNEERVPVSVQNVQRGGARLKSMPVIVSGGGGRTWQSNFGFRNVSGR